MTATWILVADSSRARLFSINRALDPLHEIGNFERPEARAKNHDLTTDRQGAVDGMGSVEIDMSPKRHEALTFAKELSEHLRQGRVSGQFNRLHIAASPSFLGLLREKLDQPTAQLVVHEVCKDLTQLDTADIRKHLPERL